MPGYKGVNNVGVTPKKFRLFKGHARDYTCEFFMGLQVSLRELEMDVVKYSTADFTIGQYQFQYNDVAALDLAVTQARGSRAPFAVSNIQITNKDGQEFALFATLGHFDARDQLNERVVELFTQLNESWKPLKQAKYSPLIKRTILDLGTKFIRLQIAEIAESCKVPDEALIINTVEDMIAKHQIDAQYFTSTRAVAFNQQANLASRDAFVAELEAEFANWSNKVKDTKKN